MPSSRRISAECSPSSGGARRTRSGVSLILSRETERVHASSHRVLDVFNHLTRMRVRIREDLGEIVDGPRRDPAIRS